MLKGIQKKYNKEWEKSLIFGIGKNSHLQKDEGSTGLQTMTCWPSTVCRGHLFIPLGVLLSLPLLLKRLILGHKALVWVCTVPSTHLLLFVFCLLLSVLGTGPQTTAHHKPEP